MFKDLFDFSNLITNISSSSLSFVIFFIILSLTRQSYKDFKFINKISEITDFSIFPNIVFITTPISNSYVIIYKSAIKIFWIICLYFIKN